MKKLSIASLFFILIIGCKNDDIACEGFDFGDKEASWLFFPEGKEFYIFEDVNNEVITLNKDTYEFTTEHTIDGGNVFSAIAALSGGGSNGGCVKPALVSNYSSELLDFSIENNLLELRANYSIFGFDFDLGNFNLRGEWDEINIDEIANDNLIDSLELNNNVFTNVFRIDGSYFLGVVTDVSPVLWVAKDQGLVGFSVDNIIYTIKE